MTQRGKGDSSTYRDIGWTWTILNVLLRGRAVWCSMLFSVPRCETWRWQHAFSRNIPAWTTQSLSPTWWEECVPPAASRAGQGQQCSMQVWEVQESQERSMRVSHSSPSHCREILSRVWHSDLAQGTLPCSLSVTQPGTAFYE